MQRIFTVYYSRDIDEVNDFLGENGKILSVTPQRVGGNGDRGHLLIVANDGRENGVAL